CPGLLPDSVFHCLVLIPSFLLPSGPSNSPCSRPVTIYQHLLSSAWVPDSRTPFLSVVLARIADMPLLRSPVPSPVSGFRFHDVTSSGHPSVRKWFPPSGSGYNIMTIRTSQISEAKPTVLLNSSDIDNLMEWNALNQAIFHAIAIVMLEKANLYQGLYQRNMSLLRLDLDLPQSGYVYCYQDGDPTTMRKSHKQFVQHFEPCELKHNRNTFRCIVCGLLVPLASPRSETKAEAKSKSHRGKPYGLLPTACQRPTKWPTNRPMMRI
ncbi:hypothetical protein C8F01DRAFT_1305718, partial [Mycena amicta]